jgi:two-component system cell cycle sensor histidine kinase PleC
MARSDAATASTQPYTTSSIAAGDARRKPRRIALREPALRWSVPALVILFLLTVGGGALFHILEMRDRALAAKSESLDLVAARLAQDLDGLAAATPAESASSIATAYVQGNLPEAASANGRGLMVADQQGRIVAMTGTG